MGAGEVRPRSRRRRHPRARAAVARRAAPTVPRELRELGPLNRTPRPVVFACTSPRRPRPGQPHPRAYTVLDQSPAACRALCAPAPPATPERSAARSSPSRHHRVTRTRFGPGRGRTRASSVHAALAVGRPASRRPPPRTVRSHVYDRAFRPCPCPAPSPGSRRNVAQVVAPRSRSRRASPLHRRVGRRGRLVDQDRAGPSAASRAAKRGRSLSTSRSLTPRSASAPAALLVGHRPAASARGLRTRSARPWRRRRGRSLAECRTRAGANTTPTSGSGRCEWMGRLPCGQGRFTRPQPGLRPWSHGCPRSTSTLAVTSPLDAPGEERYSPTRSAALPRGLDADASMPSPGVAERSRRRPAPGLAPSHSKGRTPGRASSRGLRENPDELSRLNRRLDCGPEGGFPTRSGKVPDAAPLRHEQITWAADPGRRRLAFRHIPPPPSPRSIARFRFGASARRPARRAPDPPAL